VGKYKRQATDDEANYFRGRFHVESLLLIFADCFTGRNQCQTQYFPLVGTLAAHTADMAASMQKQLGQFLRKRRGEMTLPAYARMLGISSSSLHRMEMGEQNVTLKTLELLLKRLKCSAADVFNKPNA
jgi:DNA-binding Xre family transcriptional regulator